MFASSPSEDFLPSAVLSPLWFEYNSFYLRISILPGISYLRQDVLREKASILSEALLFLTEDKEFAPQEVEGLPRIQHSL